MDDLERTSEIEEVLAELGIAPEHYETPLSEVVEALKPNMRGHGWRQRGTEVYCTTCPFEHGFTVPPGTQLVGVDDTGPKFKKVY